MATSEGQSPKAIIHQRILETAESQPDAPLNDIASDVSGASVDLVERVLEEHGDPANPSTEPKVEEVGEDTSSENASSSNSNSTASANHLSWDALPSRIRETLREVCKHPEATQREIAERLGVTGSTVSNRLSDVDGFEWSERMEFVERLPDIEVKENGHEPSEGDGSEIPRSDGEGDETNTLTEVQAETPHPELVHKVIRVCMDSEAFSEEEEIALIALLIRPLETTSCPHPT